MKKLFKKILTVFICMALFGTVNITMPAYAQETDMSKIAGIIEIFNAWGITKGANISEDMADEFVTVEDINAIFGNLNLIPPVFDGDIVRQKDFAEAVVDMLGYKSMVEQRGGYIAMAQELNLFKGVKTATHAAETYEYVLYVLDNAMNTRALVADYTNPSRVTYVKSKGTFSEDILHIYKSKDIVRANGQYALEAQYIRRDEYAVIGTTDYLKNGVNIDDLLGCWVDFYYRSDDSDEIPQLLYAKMRNDKNMIVIASEDIDDYSNKQYAYFDNDRRKTVKLAADSVVIYNSVPASKYTDEMMKPISGSVILIDSDGNGSYDVANITSYTYIMAGAIDTYKNKIYDKSNPTLSLEYDEDTYFVLPDGTSVTIEQVPENSVLSVAANEERTTVIVTNDTIVGEIVGMSNDDKTIIVDDVEYGISTGFYGSLPRLGEYAVFYLDHNADIYYYEIPDSEDIKYGYITKVIYSDDTGEDILSLRMCKTDGSIGRFNLAEKVKIDGVSYKTVEEMRKVMTDANQNTKYQLIAYKLNADEEIFYIDTPYNSPDNLQAEPGENEDKNSLRCTFSSYAGDSVNQQVANILTGNKTYYIIGGKTVLSSDTIYLSIPNDSEIPGADDEDFDAKSIYTIEDDKLCDLETYAIGNGMLSTVAIKREKAVKSIDGGDYACIVTSVGEVWNDKEGAAVQSIEVLRHGRKYELWAETDKQFPTGDGKQMCSIRYGDVVRINSTAYDTGEIKLAEVLARIEDGQPVYTDDTVRLDSVKDQAIGDYTAESQTIFASVLKKSGDVIYIKPEQTMEGQNLEPYYNVITDRNTTVYVCETNPNKGGQNITVGSVNDIITHEQSNSEYSRMLVYTAWCNPHMLVIYK